MYPYAYPTVQYSTNISNINILLFYFISTVPCSTRVLHTVAVVVCYRVVLLYSTRYINIFTFFCVQHTSTVQYSTCIFTGFYFIPVVLPYRNTITDSSSGTCSGTTTSTTAPAAKRNAITDSSTASNRYASAHPWSLHDSQFTKIIKLKYSKTRKNPNLILIQHSIFIIIKIYCWSWSLHDSDPTSSLKTKNIKL